MFSTETWAALSHPIVVAIIGFAILLMWRHDVGRPSYLLYLGLAYLAYSVGVTSQITAFPSPLTLNVLLSGVLYMTAVVLMTHGVVALADRRYAYWIPIALILVMLAGRFYFVVLDNNPKLRFYLLHITVVMVLLHGAWLARSLRKGRSAEKIMYWSFLLLAISNLPRSLFALARPDDSYGYDLSVYWVLTQASIYIFSVVFGLALINTIMQRRIGVHRTLSETDELTGLRNRRGFYDTVQRRISRVKSYTVLVADIDKFKKVNDNHGHDIGDLVLAETAGIIASSIRPEDVSGRVGGEEFAIFLPDTNLQDGHNIAERLRQNFESFRFAQDRTGLNCTISLGVAHCDSDVPLDEAIRQADQRLYQAKADGRNRVRSALSVT